ncbi:MAG TPA: ABC transporter permease [Acidimicrobiales bacterium]
MVLALREIRRSTTRFVLLTGALALLVVLIVGLQAMLGGLLTQFVGALEHQSGEVVVFGDDARRNVEGSIVDDDAVAAVRRTEGVVAADPVVEGSLTVQAGGEDVDAALFGYPLGGVGAPTTLVAGRLPEDGGEAVASEADRDDGFGLGDRVTLGEGGPTVEVVGLAADTNYLTRPTLFVADATAVEAKRAANPDAVAIPASVIAVDVAPDEDAGSVADRITAEVEGVEALPRQAAADAAPGAAATAQSMWLIIAVALAAAVLLVGFFFAILAVQQAPTYALLHAIGCPGRRLAATLAAQLALVVGVAVVVGTALVAAAEASGVMGELLDLDPAGAAGTVAVLVAGAAVASLGAFRRLRRIDPLTVVWGGTR